MAPSASTPVSAKMPGTPMSGVSAGAATSDSANVAPIVMPMAAIARERTESRVRSAASAMHRGGDRAGALDDAADDRPADRRRPRGDEAAEREDEKPRDDDGLSSPAVRRPAERDLQQRLREAVGAERDADERVVAPARKRFGVEREHRQDDEHAEHPQPEDAGEADGGAALGGGHAWRPRRWRRREARGRAAWARAAWRRRRNAGAKCAERKRWNAAHDARIA